MAEKKNNINRSQKLRLYGIAGSAAIVVGGFLLYRVLKQDKDNESKCIESATIERENAIQTDTKRTNTKCTPFGLAHDHQNGIHDTDQYIRMEQNKNDVHFLNPNKLETQTVQIDDTLDIEMITEQDLQIPQDDAHTSTPESGILITQSEDDVEEEEQAVTPNSMERVQSKEQIENQMQNENKWNQSIKKYSQIADAAAQYKRYEYKNGMLLVKVVKATNIGKSLSDASSKACANGIVELKLANNENCHTRLVKNKKNPKWNESFKLVVKDAVRDSLECVLYDNEIKESNRIGHVIINIIDIAGNNGYVYRTFDVIRSESDTKLVLELNYFEETSL
eukprot:174691_1